MRTILFILTNLLIVIVFGFFFKLLGLQNNINQISIFIMILFGFFGSIISLLLSKFVTLNSINGKIIKNPINRNEIWLLETISKFSKISNIKTPEIIIYNSNDINAFATGFNCNNSLIGLSSGLLKYMNYNQIKAVIAHEISHINNGDMVTMGLLQGVMNTFVLFFSQFISNLIYKKENQDNEKNIFLNIFNSFSFSFFEILFGSLANIVVMGFSRYREFRADADAIKFVGKYNMISALNRLKFSNKLNLKNNLKVFYINGKNFNILNNLFNSHPSIDERIKAIKNIK
ncbi:protease HtpX [Enterobacterales bacterium endosymbiont of Anomoneura mori]|uniref:protease HtpX n=1 Tax=Enterobacterales bacterium endosymbiont of Anomoneura mori TaxID=3132096 RepID=UPI00399D169B